MPRRDKFTETESEVVVARGWGRGGDVRVFKGYGVAALQDEKFCWCMVVTVAQCECADRHAAARLIIAKMVRKKKKKRGNENRISLQ